MSDSKACPTCRIVSTVCFWGPFKVASWKRPALLGLSLVLLGGCMALVSLPGVHRNADWFWFLLIPILGLGMLGLVVAVRGCIHGVARIFGGI